MVAKRKTPRKATHSRASAPPVVDRRPRGLVIGNSYAIALKDGIEDSSVLPKGDFSFICAPGSELLIKIEDKIVKPISERFFTKTADGLETKDIRLDDYDFIVLVGLGVSASQVGRIHKTFQIYGNAEPRKTLISMSALTAATAALLEKTISYKIACDIRLNTNKPIFIVPQPMPLDKLPVTQPDTERLERVYNSWKDFMVPDKGRNLYDIFLNAATSAFNSIGATFVRQPDSTLLGVFTHSDYQMMFRTTYERAQQVPATTVDMSHMNSEFGKLTVEELWRDRILASALDVAGSAGELR